jgi:hypothetical protein
MVSKVLRYVSEVWVIDFCPETGILVVALHQVTVNCS